MKKNLLFLLFLFTILFSSYAFDCDDKFYLRNPDDVMKIGDEIALYFGDSYEIKNLNEYILDDDGWYRTSYCGKDMYVIFGSNYFLYHSNYEYGPYFYKDDPLYNFGSSFLKITSFDDFIKKYNMWSIQKNTEVSVPDFLTEKINNVNVQYNTADMENFYIRDWETNMQYVKYNSKPWATSKEPNHMIIDVNFSTSTDALVILNGYIHPDKRYLYKANRRLKTVKVTSKEADFNLTVSFEDVVHFHEIKLPEAVKNVKIEILDYYEGKKYKDLCIQMIGTKNHVFYSSSEFSSFDELSYNGRVPEYKK